MKLNKRQAPPRLEIPMAPMINVMFLLLLFFMLNLKIVAPEGNIEINLPISAPVSAAQSNTIRPDIKVGLTSDRDGNLVSLTLDGKDLGYDNQAFDRLNAEILAIIGRPGNPLMKDIEVEIDADFECQHKYVVKAISRCTGRLDPQTQQIARYIEKIKFAPPHKPK